MTHHPVHVVARNALLGMLAFCSALAAEDRDKRFSEQYGEELQRVRQTREVSDDLDLARRMLEEAHEHTDQPEWLGRLCHQAYRLSYKRSDGQSIAVEAMRLRAEHLPEVRVRSLEAVSRIYRRQFTVARGEEKKEVGRELLQARLDAAEAMEKAGQWERAAAAYRKALMVAAAVRADSDQRQQIQRRRGRVQARLRRRQRIEQLREHVKQQPADAEAVRSLAKLLVITGQPQAAAEHRDRLEDSPLKRHLTLVTKDTAELTEDEARQLGSWFRDLASDEPELGPAPLVKLAYQCYDRYLLLHVDDDEDRRAAEQARSQLRDKLDQLGIDPPPPPVDKLAVNRPSADDPPRRNMRRSLPGRRSGRERGSNKLFEALRAPEEMRRQEGAGPGWTEVLPKVRVGAAEERGGWMELPGGGIEGRIPESGDPAPLVTPIRITRGSFRLHLRFMIRGSGRLRLIIPAADRAAELIIAADASERSGFRGIEGSAPDQTLLNPVKVQPDQLQILSVQATPMEEGRIRLSAGLNGQPLAEWEGPAAKLAASPPDRNVPDAAPALMLHGSEGSDAVSGPAGVSFTIKLEALNLKLLENGEARMLRSKPRSSPR